MDVFLSWTVLRGLAILLVLVYHYIKAGVVRTGFWYALGLAPLRLTWSGVDLFFVLSGFLIGGILLDTKNESGYYRVFFARRIHRIFPLYYAWLLLFVIGLAAAEPNLKGMFNTALPLWCYPIYLQNFMMLVCGTMGSQWLMVTWSLAVEEQFYVTLPFLVRKLSVTALQRVVIAMIVSAPLARIALLIFHAPFGGMLLFTRGEGLGFGLLLALAIRQQDSWLQALSRRFFWQTFLVLACGIPILSLKLPGFITLITNTWLALFYSNLLILTVVKPGIWTRRIFCNGFLIWMGTVSYGIYLFHVGILGLMFFFLRHTAAEIDDWPSLLITLASVMVTFAVAQGSWLVFEKPIITRGRKRHCYGLQASARAGQ